MTFIVATQRTRSRARMKAHSRRAVPTRSQGRARLLGGRDGRAARAGPLPRDGAAPRDATRLRTADRLQGGDRMMVRRAIGPGEIEGERCEVVALRHGA